MLISALCLTASLLVVPSSLMTGAPRRAVFIQIWPPRESFLACFSGSGLVLIMNTFWFYKIIQIHYDLCQIIVYVHVKNA